MKLSSRNPIIVTLQWIKQLLNTLSQAVFVVAARLLLKSYNK